MAKVNFTFTLANKEIEDVCQSLISGGIVTLIDKHTGINVQIQKEGQGGFDKYPALKAFINQLDAC